MLYIGNQKIQLIIFGPNPEVTIISRVPFLLQLLIRIENDYAQIIQIVHIHLSNLILKANFIKFPF